MPTSCRISHSHFDRPTGHIPPNFVDHRAHESLFIDQLEKMPETRRSKRIASSEDVPPRFRLTVAADPFLNSPEFTTDLYSSHPTAPIRDMTQRGRLGPQKQHASSSNAMDVDGLRHGLYSAHLSDEESLSDEELNVNLPVSSGLAGGPRGRGQRRMAPPATSTSFRTSLAPHARRTSCSTCLVGLAIAFAETECSSRQAKALEADFFTHSFFRTFFFFKLFLNSETPFLSLSL